jgi:Deacetylases, including yeast histone deacetylase and acetoin utilization protein
LYTYGIDKNSRFPRERYELTKKQLSNFPEKIIFNKPKMISVNDIYLAHEKNYVDSFLNGSLTVNEKRKIGLQPWNKHIINRTKYILGGSVGALDFAVNHHTVSANMAGGTHHAHYSFGSGYCVFNDLAICAFKCIRDYKRIKNILIIDLDVHQGDGTASILNKEDSIFTFSIHCENNFPLKKMKSNIDISLNKNVGDK